MGRKKRARQSSLWIEPQRLADGPSHPFYERLSGVLEQHGFDRFVEDLCEPFYAKSDGGGRPSIAPGVYFRMLLVGYFEGIDSERGIAWRVADSLALRRFLGYELADRTPEHSSLTRIRQRLTLDVYQTVFDWVLKVLAQEKLLRGKTLGVDATTLEANAALRSIVRRDTGESYQDFLTRLAKASGIEAPTREDLARLDRKRPHKGSNQDWIHPHDPDAAITKMKDGRTHLAHKSEHAVDMETGAVVAVHLTGADQGDTTSMPFTVMAAEENLAQVAKDPIAARQLHPATASEVVADKGYHSNDVLTTLKDDGIRTYISEPDRGPRNWKDNGPARQATYDNRRRLRGPRGQRLRKRRGEILERTFAHVYETGAMRRLHLRQRENILKRLLVHVGGFNLSLVMRKIFGVGTPRALQGLVAATLTLLLSLYRLLTTLLPPMASIWPSSPRAQRRPQGHRDCGVAVGTSTGC